MKRNKEPKADYVAEEHGPVYNFFYSYKTHFYQLMTGNIMFIVLNIPMLFLSAFLMVNALPWISPSLEQEKFVNYWNNVAGAVGNEDLGNKVTQATDGGAGYQLYFLLIVFAVMFVIGTCLICIGPFQAGFNQLYRNLHRQEGIFLVGDFKEGVKNNWKQSTGAMIIGLLVTILLFVGTGFYLNSMGGKMGTFLGTVFVVFFACFIVIQNMVYQQIVTLDLPLGKIYKNAILFFVIKLGPCIGFIFLIIMLLAVLPFSMLFTTNYGLMGFTLFYYALFIFTFVQYMLAFFTGEIIDEYIVSKLPPKPVEDDFYDDDYSTDEESEEDTTDEEETVDSEDSDVKEESEEEDEFILIPQENQLDDE